eukprot:TRINITY_DN13823_c0_g1_i2.p1 TRINITY_DN13823_c0_g1~~TRINITY_DN13823_c0_g1_i2.p1  ORF type:complete len:485 (-),score=81.48 TRINITY_DN13823_c0_g1_i2:68-1522(-)
MGACATCRHQPESFLNLKRVSFTWRSKKKCEGTTKDNPPETVEVPYSGAIKESLIASAEDCVTEPVVEDPSRWRHCFCCARRGRKQEPPVQLESFAKDEHGASSPTLDALDMKQRSALAEMRARIDALPESNAPPKRHDLWLKRFLVHGKWNLEKALKLYLEMEAWRRNVGADNVFDVAPDVKLNKVLQMDTVGWYPYSEDRSGRTIIWMSVGLAPWWRALFERTDESLRAQLWNAENLDRLAEQRARRTGVWQERAVVLVDLSHLEWKYFKGLSGSSRARRRGEQQTVAQYYPGNLDAAYVINAPNFVNTAWKVVKCFLSAKLMEKAVVVNSTSRKNEMLKKLGAENVPRSLGGTSDALSIEMPQSLQMPRAGWGSVIQAWSPKEISIKPVAKHEEMLVVPPGKRARWQWALASGSVFFSVDRVVPGRGQVNVMAKEGTFNDLEEPIFGETSMVDVCTEVRFTWDNTASKKTSKTLFVRVEVV